MINNRRLNEVRKDIQFYQDRLRRADSIGECLIYQGKLESLEREEKEILTRYKKKEVKKL